MHEEMVLFGDVVIEDFELLFDVDEESLCHVAGYCVSAVSKYCYRTSGCRECVSRFAEGEKGALTGSAYQNHLQRGGLFVPNELSKVIAKYGLCLLNQLCDSPKFKNDFLRCQNQKKVLTFLIQLVIEDLIEPEDECLECGKPLLTLLRVFISSLTNTLLKAKGNLFNNQLELEKEKERIQRQGKAQVAKKKKAEKLESSSQAPAKVQKTSGKAPVPHHARKTQIFNQ